jgi:uncharacterized membrane protein
VIHPLLVHLPIGIILLAVCFEWIVYRERYTFLRASLLLIWRLGAIAAIITCISGWWMRHSGEYDGATVDYHQWAGIATALLATGACFIKTRFWWSFITAIVLIATGHLGGTLTHGEGFLFPQKEDIPPVAFPDIQQVGVYTEMVAPIFSHKCVSCHGPDKQKGNLRLDSPEQISKGGKHGNLLAGISGSELIKRCKLPLTDEHHMPPKGKSQISAAELQLIEWWILQGGDFQKKAVELMQPEPIKALLANWGKSHANAPLPAADLPDTLVGIAPLEHIRRLQNAGLTVIQIAQGSPWLSVSFVNQYTPGDSLFALLELVAPQVTRLNLSDVIIPENAWPHLAKLSCLSKVYLNGSSLKDNDLQYFSGCRHLVYLNLSNTSVTQAVAAPLADIPGLKRVYLYQTRITSAEWTVLFSALPGVKVDTGNYHVPTFVSDTTMLKEEKKY